MGQGDSDRHMNPGRTRRHDLYWQDQVDKIRAALIKQGDQGLFALGAQRGLAVLAQVAGAHGNRAGLQKGALHRGNGAV